MKKKIINGILLVALIFATSSAFVSCKDNDSDVKTELYAKIAALQSQIDQLNGQVGPQGPEGPQGPAGKDGITPHIGDNGNWFIGDKDTGLKAKGENGENGTAPSIDDIIAALQDKLNEIQANATAAATEAALAELEKQVGKLKEILDAIYKTQVTSLNIDAIKNPVFGFVSAPVDVQSNMLIACYGKAASDIEFPVGSGEYVAYADDVLTLDGNAGKLYVTVNPSSVDFSGKTLTLESTSGKQAPVELSPLAISNEDLYFGWPRGENAFYETTATIPEDKLADAAIDFTKQDLLDLKDEAIALIQNRTKRSGANLIKDLYDLYARNMFAAYRLKATWGEGYNTFSETKIAALALQPLSYSFDPEGAIEEKDLEKIENQINKAFEIEGTSIENRINKFWDKFNAFTLDKIIGNINYALHVGKK